ncbi:hypothetical protein IE077_004513 [Cardiosporidium cionae]|uniref:RRM domain-containing protein n=1 Tax=Cardiosporidium cionae TaxID=476202 RepID=A0ABQ7J8G4_9APIC|nr:hypothetical protein IE077_004513 [Cardiosporidium cionae]|eukprot:KAF8820277.1 hypothetical protein IE077_004513 [Cardiosporidium cionae]
MSTRNCRVFVRNLPWDVRWQDLKDHMRKAGDVVRADVIVDAGGRSRGWGIVEYAAAEDANRAIAELNESTLFDRVIFVREDREKPRQGPYNTQGGRDYRSRNDNSSDHRNYEGYGGDHREGYSDEYRGRDNYGGEQERNGGHRISESKRYDPRSMISSDSGNSFPKILLSNLPYRASKDEVKGLVASVTKGSFDVELEYDDRNRPRGSATIYFESSADARSAGEQLDSFLFDGRSLRVS